VQSVPITTTVVSSNPLSAKSCSSSKTVKNILMELLAVVLRFDLVLLELLFVPYLVFVDAGYN
jgi:hypothetical protein